MERNVESSVELQPLLQRSTVEFLLRYNTVQSCSEEALSLVFAEIYPLAASAKISTGFEIESRCFDLIGGRRLTSPSSWAH